MRLTDYIEQNMEAILAEWEAFAATLLPAAGRMTPLALRDHAQQILTAVAKDIASSQTREDQVAKSKGQLRGLPGAPETAAQTHAVLRAVAGFDINQLASEYRALRASVLRLWIGACQPELPHVGDIIRFNEAIDQALAESINFFNAKVEQWRNLLLGMIGHELRSPLQSIQMTAAHLAALNAGEPVSKAASRLISSGSRIQALLDDLVDFNRSKLGLGIHVTPTETDLPAALTDELEQLRAAYPGRTFVLEANGGARSLCDAKRIGQVLTNLVGNAIKYGAPDAPIRILVEDDEADVRMEVINLGPTVKQAALDRMFEPLTRGAEQQKTNTSGSSLGLGLFIAREIAKAHGGDITARSQQNETIFSVRLPRQQR